MSEPPYLEIASIMMNLIDACLGNICSKHEAIIFLYKPSIRKVYITIVMSSENEESSRCAEDIFDEFSTKIDINDMSFEAEIIYNNLGVFALARGQRPIFLRNNFRLIFPENFLDSYGYIL